MRRRFAWEIGEQRERERVIIVLSSLYKLDKSEQNKLLNDLINDEKKCVFNARFARKTCFDAIFYLLRHHLPLFLHENLFK